MIRKTRGQTLIEVMITLLIIAVGVIALIRFQNYLAYNNAVTQQKGDATLLAIKQLETLRDFQVLNTTTGYTSYQSIATGSSSVTLNNTAFTVSWTVTSHTSPTYKTLSVTVTWTDRYSTSNSVTLVSNVAGIEPANSSSIM